MSFKISELRSYAQPVQPASESGGWLLAATLGLCVLGGGYYAYAKGMLRIPGFNAPAPQQSASPRPAPATPAPAPAPQVASAAPPAPKPVATSAPKQAGGPTREQITDAAGLVLKIRMNNDAMEEFGLMAMDSVFGERPRAAPAKPDQIFQFCKEHATKAAALQSQLPLAEAELHLFHVMGEAVSCLLKRPVEHLCNPKHRERLLRQIRAYGQARADLIALAESEAEKAAARRALDRAAHRDVAGELKKHAARGVINIGEFGWFASPFIKESIAEHKGVKPSCPAKAG